MQLPPNSIKAPKAFSNQIYYRSDLARMMEEHCRTHRQARIHKLQTPLWCDRYENCLDCLMDFANRYVPSQTAKGEL